MIDRYIGHPPFAFRRLVAGLGACPVTAGLCAGLICVFVFLLHRFGSVYLVGGQAPPDEMLDFYDRFGVSPALIAYDLRFMLAWVSSLFVHLGPVHLLANLAFLLPAGVMVERRVGSSGSLAVFVAGGVLGAVAHCWVFPTSHLSLVGASGGVAALCGVVWVAVPLRSPVWSSDPQRAVMFRCYMVLVPWVMFQLLTVVVDVSSRGDVPIAFLPHVTGLVVGLAVGVVVRLADPLPVPLGELDRRPVRKK